MGLLLGWRISKIRLFTIILALSIFIMALHFLPWIKTELLNTSGPPQPIGMAVRAEGAGNVQVPLVNSVIDLEVLVKLVSTKLEYAPRKLPEEAEIIEAEPELFSVIPHQFLPNLLNPCWYEESFENVKSQHRIKFHQQGDKLFHLRCLPYVYIIGQPKCGTTDLFNRLQMHPEANYNHIKEPKWWTKTGYVVNDVVNMVNNTGVQDYLDLYNWAGVNIQAGLNGRIEKDFNPLKGIAVDASPSLMWDNRARNVEKMRDGVEPMVLIEDLIHKVQPGAKIIAIIRDPTERLYSSYLYTKESFLSKEHFHSLVERLVKLFQSCLSEKSLRFCAYNPDLMHSLDWLTVFPREQILILRYEDYATNVEEELKKVFDFLRLDPLTPEKEKEVFQKKIYNTQEDQYEKIGPMLPTTKHLLRELYKPFNNKLASLLEDEAFLWNET
ncbi:carbohydrate sulfotransferase 15-like isoform X2 [Solea solea]|uniref:carbohydrate sulfotransferase 15-like isoform X2 n=1 Tax=Solea solea TaxID=90069 RepID=UPI00272D7CCA|nr:carbohydrate sulfotransferase 15-like isoform X2 [Solea solea]